MTETVNHPPHYTAHPSGIEAIDVCEHMSFCLGNAVKYLWRAGQKGDRLEDLKKALWYLDREDLRRPSVWQAIGDWTRSFFYEDRDAWVSIARDVIKATEGPDLLAAVLGKLIAGDELGARRSVAIAIDFEERQREPREETLS